MDARWRAEALSGRLQRAVRQAGLCPSRDAAVAGVLGGFGFVEFDAEAGFLVGAGGAGGDREGFGEEVVLVEESAEDVAGKVRSRSAGVRPGIVGETIVLDRITQGRAGAWARA